MMTEKIDMASILKILALLSSLLSTIYLIIWGVRSGLLIIATIFSLLKIIILLAFLALLVYIFYLMLPSKDGPSPNEN
jgi:hypothetical protein